MLKNAKNYHFDTKKHQFADKLMFQRVEKVQIIDFCTLADFEKWNRILLFVSGSRT